MMDWAVRAIVILAGGLRFAYLLQIEHNTDRAYPVWQALMTLDRGVWPLIGQGTSVLFANPPLMGYLLLPVVALTRSALGAVVFVVALNTLGVWFTYKAGRLIGGSRVGLIAACLMAVNPWIIEYSRLTWVQGLLPLLVPALAWALWSALEGRARRPGRRLLLAWIVLTIAAQTYLLAFALVVPFGLTLVLYARMIVRDRALRAACVVGALIFMAAGALYAAGLANGTAPLDAQIAAFGSSGARISSEALSHAFRLVTGADYAIARGVDAPVADAARRQAAERIAAIALSVALIAGAILASVRAVRGSRRMLLPIVWFGVPIALMTLVSQVVHPFYQLLGLPAGFILAGVGIDALIRLRPRLIAPLVMIAGVGLGVLMAVNSTRYAQETAQTPGAHGLTALSLEYGLPLGAEVRAQYSGTETVINGVEPWIVSSLAGIAFDTLQESRAPDLVIVPREGAIYVRADDAPLLFSPAPQRFALPDETTLMVERVQPQDILTMELQFTELQFNGEDGIVPVGVRLEADEDGQRLITVWQVSDPLPTNVGETLFASFAHVFNPAGERVLIVDGGAVAGYLWQAGDLHVHTMRFTLPDTTTEPYTIAIGQYDAQRGRNAIFISPEGMYTPTVTLAR